MEKFKQILKGFGKIPTLVWLGIMFGSNIVVAMIGNIPAIITVNAVLITVALIAIFSRYIK